jgi:transposase
VRHLLPEIPPGHTVIMGNARFHRKDILQRLADEAGVALLFLPPYSPDFNPIEQSWANLKRWLTDNLSLFPFFDFALEYFFFFSDF